MKTPIRHQSQLLPRRSYRPQRCRRWTLPIAFQPAPLFIVRVAEEDRKNPDFIRSDSEVIALSG